MAVGLDLLERVPELVIIVKGGKIERLGYSRATDSSFIPWEIVAIRSDVQPGNYADGLHGVRRPPPHPVFWVIAVAMVVVAATLVMRTPYQPNPFVGSPAFAQAATSGAARGVFAFSGQLSKGTYGVYVVDVDAMTIWVYEYLPQKSCLRLASARTWRYDRYLENHNICDLPPDAVEKLIEDQRQYRLESSENDTP